jgi:hypothetical protein
MIIDCDKFEITVNIKNIDSMKVVKDRRLSIIYFIPDEYGN